MAAADEQAGRVYERVGFQPFADRAGVLRRGDG